MFFGTVSGGLSSKLTGGNFWEGAAIGLVVSGLNHVAHKTFTNDCPKCPKFKRWAEKRGGNTDLQKHLGDAIPLEEWLEIYKDKTYDEIVNENPKNMGMPGGPKKRYVINPYDGNVMDMRHVMVVGFGYGRLSGFLVEHLKYAGDWFGLNTRGSAYDAQDYYSNDIGARYYNYRFKGIFSESPFSNFKKYFDKFLQSHNK